MMITPLEQWIRAKIGASPTKALDRTSLDNYQLQKLRETVDHARLQSPFYRRRLDGVRSDGFRSLADISRLPFTTAADIQEDDLQFLCVSRDEIERVVTLHSSGTTAPAKRLHFTSEDIELTVDFFHHGMSTLVQPGDRVLILMPGELPGSVGDLLVKGVGRMGVAGIVHGLVRDAGEVIAEIAEREIDCLVGIPVQVLGLARHPAAALLPPGRLKSILLSADYVPDAVVRELSSVWGVTVYNHYGMTEMGLGGGVECRHGCGYHLREADLYWEVVDPDTGRQLPYGEFGEVVFTTLTRRGMPLIRYRTGDLARFLPEPCPCGTVLRRLERVRGRTANRVRLAGGDWLTMADLDEALFMLPFLLNFQPLLRRCDGREILDVSIETTEADVEKAVRLVRRTLLNVPAVGAAVENGSLAVGRIEPGSMAVSGSIKRKIEDRRKEKKHVDFVDCSSHLPAVGAGRGSGAGDGHQQIRLCPVSCRLKNDRPE